MKKAQTYITLIAFLAVLAAVTILEDQVQAKDEKKTPIEFFTAIGEDKCSELLNRKVLEESLELGTRFMLNNQHSSGNFTYVYNWINKGYYPFGDSQVRQAGAAWGLTLIHQYKPSVELAAAIEKGLAFFKKHSKTNAEGLRFVVYPGDSQGSTGTVALTALAHIDYLRAVKDKLPLGKLTKLEKDLDGYLAFLLDARRNDGLWHSHYSNSTGEAYGSASPYADGESLLALVKAAKYLGRDNLWNVIIPAATAGYKYNIEEALKIDPDSKTTKGYYQWSSMAFFEITTSGRPDAEKYGTYVVELADWMIDVHKTLERTRNTAYAYEGIIHAYEIARQRALTPKLEKFRCVIELGLEKLTSWQVGSPIANKYIRQHRTEDPKAIGGVQNHSKEEPLRIDVAQHQMHAVVLALMYVFLQ